MVYCGKPSRGCENCRRLHTKCDLKYPACSRCVRMKKICVGYRDQSKFMFRDETLTTQNKVRQRRVDSHRPDMSVATSHNLPWPTHLISPKGQDFALCFFYHKTLNNLSERDPARHLQMYLPSLYAQSSIGSALRLAAESISHALSPEFIPGAANIARKRYAEALDAIQHAIQDPIEARNDETLYAILLLCGYETMTRETAIPSAWATHVGGAAALVQYRGSNQLRSRLARGLFGFVRRSIVLSHMQTCHPVDDVFTEPGAYEDPEDQLIAIASRIPKLQQLGFHIFTQFEVTHKSQLETLVHEAKVLDKELSDWASSVPIAWSYANATGLEGTKSTSTFSPKHIHRYLDFYVARVWNFYRVSRLILQSLLHQATLVMQKSGEIVKMVNKEKAETRSRICDLVNDICASVPFLLGHDLSKMTVTGASKEDKPEPSSTGSFSLIWPLYVASSAIAIPEDQRSWIHRQLETIAVNGDSQAHMVLGRENQTLLGGPDVLQFDCV